MNTKGNPTQSTRRVVSKEQIVTDLRNMGLKEGDHVAVTLSLKSIGYLKGGPEELIEAFLEVLGSNGTLMMNTFTYHFPLSSIPTDYVFDHKLTPAYTGIVPETFRKRKDAIRSKHPTCSVAVIGKQAEYLTKGHNAKSDHFLPYSRLAKINGRYLCIGIGDRLVAIRHEAQHRAGLSNIVPLYHGAKYKTDQGKVKLFVQNSFGCVKNLPKLVPDLRKRGILKTGNVGMAQAYLASARELVDSMAMMLKKNPKLNLCSDGFCIWCREVERRMNLFIKIKNPKFYQKNNVMIRLLALVNGIRLNNFNFLLFREGKREFNAGKIQALLRVASEFLNGLCLTFRAKFHLTK